MKNKIFGICKNVLKITDEEVSELREIAKQQQEYCHPLKMATTAWQNELGKYNDKVLDKILELKAVLEQGSSIQAP